MSQCGVDGLIVARQAVEADCALVRESRDAQRQHHEQSVARWQQQVREAERVEQRLRTKIAELNERISEQLRDLDLSRQTIEQQNDKLLAIDEQSDRLLVSI